MKILSKSGKQLSWARLFQLRRIQRWPKRGSRRRQVGPRAALAAKWWATPSGSAPSGAKDRRAIAVPTNFVCVASDARSLSGNAGGCCSILDLSPRYVLDCGSREILAVSSVGVRLRLDVRRRGADRADRGAAAQHGLRRSALAGEQWRLDASEPTPKRPGLRR